MALQSLKEVEMSLCADDVVAYKANYEAFKGGKDTDELVDYYNNWSELYDEHLNQERYAGPEQAAQTLANYFSDDERKRARIIDVAAGTGRLGAELFRLGFRTIDALDPSTGMLNKAKEKAIYTNIFHGFIGKGSTVPVEDNTYDGLAVSGGFGEGHIPVSALEEMIRVVKPGGIICIALREEYLSYVSGYKDVFEPILEDLQQTGKWKLLNKSLISNYAFKKPGVIFQLRVS